MMHSEHDRQRLSPDLPMPVCLAIGAICVLLVAGLHML